MLLKYTEATPGHTLCLCDRRLHLCPCILAFLAALSLWHSFSTLWEGLGPCLSSCKAQLPCQSVKVTLKKKRVMDKSLVKKAQVKIRCSHLSVTPTNKGQGGKADHQVILTGGMCTI